MGPSEAKLIELKKFRDSEVDGINVVPTDIPKQWKCEIMGPVDTPYADGHFFVILAFPAKYPFEPPKIKFLTKIFHCNVNSENGSICLDILGRNWSPALHIEQVLVSLRSLLSTPNPDAPLVHQPAYLFINNRVLHDETAKKWTQRYATPVQTYHTDEDLLGAKTCLIC